jgi:hypothetical protein
VNFDTKRDTLYNLCFVGGPACGKSYKVGQVFNSYEHEDGEGRVFAYDVVPSQRRGWGYAAICTGEVER